MRQTFTVFAIVAIGASAGALAETLLSFLIPFNKNAFWVSAVGFGLLGLVMALGDFGPAWYRNIFAREFTTRLKPTRGESVYWIVGFLVVTVAILVDMRLRSH